MQRSKPCTIHTLLTYTPRSDKRNAMLLGRLIQNPFSCNRCECSCCDFMPTSVECICCKEIARIVEEIGEANDTAVTCITGHPAFEGVCLNVWILQAAYFQYRQEHGSSSLPPSFHKYACNNCNIHYSLYSNFLLQKIQIHHLSAANKIVLGVAQLKYQSDTTSLC